MRTSIKYWLSWSVMVVWGWATAYSQDHPTILPLPIGPLVNNQAFWVEIKVGDPAPVTNLYGISFKIKSLKSAVTYVDGSAAAGAFLGSSLLTFFQKIDVQTIDLAISKTSGAGISGAGVVAKVQFIGTDVGSLDFLIYDISAYDSDGNPIVLDTPLPVDLICFNAIPNMHRMELMWKTATEINNYGFDIERKFVPQNPLVFTKSGNASEIPTYSKIGFIQGSGNSNVQKEYSFLDTQLSPGKYCYRLKQIDRDGQYHYSPEAEATITIPTQITLLQNYPNPFNPTTTIMFSIPSDGFTTLKIIDILGREVSTLFEGKAQGGLANHIQFNAAGLASGIYFSRLEYNGGVHIKKLLLMR